MAIFKCKMCGGSLEVNGDSSVATCEYCGSVQTLPKKNDDVVANLFNRANNLRIKCEFDKATEVYERILNQDNNDSEAHWGLVLCKYGIEYVEDPKTSKRIPTCHRTQYESILGDIDYLAAIGNSDTVSADVYKAQAEEIANLQKDILAIVKNEKPFDVFICYKESDENGKRTVDSALANDIYYQLTQEGMKVFYAAITLEDKLGVEYEPYIFAALNSAKVMLVVGTKPEYFEAIWVKNEWSRYLKLMKADRSKMLIPCYRDMDAYDLPEEFSHLQAQDMSKIGFVNDIVRGIKKVVKADVPKPETVIKETVVTTGNANTAPLLKRAFMFLEDGDWSSADEYCEKVLDLDPECGEAYLGKLMAMLKVKKCDDLKHQSQVFNDNINFKKAVRFGDEQLVNTLNDYIEFIEKRNEEARLDAIYLRAVSEMKRANTAEEYRIAASKFKEVVNKEYKNSKELYDQCIENAEDLEEKGRLEKYEKALDLKNNAKISYDYFKAEEIFKDLSLINYKDSKKLKEECNKLYISAMYDDVVKSMKSAEKISDCERIETLLQKIIDYKDAKKLLEECNLLKEKFIKEQEKVDLYEKALHFEKIGKYPEAIVEYDALNDYKDCKARIEHCNLKIREKQAERRKNLKRLLIAASVAVAVIILIVIYSTVISPAINYSKAEKFAANNDSLSAVLYYQKAKNHKDAKEKAWTLREIVEGECNTVDYYRDELIAAVKNDGKVLVKVGIDDKDSLNTADFKDVVAVYTKDNTLCAVKADGTLLYAGPSNTPGYDLSQLANGEKIKKIIYTYSGAIAITEDRNLILSENLSSSDMNSWTDIVAVSAGDYHTAGLKSDGTVVAVGDDEYGQCDVVYDWTDIVAVSAGRYHTVGLKSDGTVVATKYTGDYDDYSGECDVSDWTDIKAVYAAGEMTVGLKKDGTVVSTLKKFDATKFTDIVSLNCDSNEITAVRSDGTVVCYDVSLNKLSDKYNDWSGIVMMVGYGMGLKYDGSLQIHDDNSFASEDVRAWKDIKIPEHVTTDVSGISKTDKDKKEKLYADALAKLQSGDKIKALAEFRKLGDYKDAKEKAASLWEEFINDNRKYETVSAGWYHTVGLRSDGTVVATKYTGDYDDYSGQCNVSAWTDIVAVSAGSYHTVGLKSDGTVVAVGSSGDDRCDVSDWTDIVAVSAGSYHTVGLKPDGTVVAVGSNGSGQCDVSDWTDIVAVSAGRYHTVGLKFDGTVVATEYTGDDDDYYGQCNVSDWTDIVAVSAGGWHTVGLKSDGTVVAVGYNDSGRCNVSDWTDIVAVSAGWYHTVGLRSDGMVVPTEYTGDDDYYYSQCDVSAWTDIVAVSAGGRHTVGIKSDGTVVATEYTGDDDYYGQCDVDDFKNIKIYETKQSESSEPETTEVTTESEKTEETSETDTTAATKEETTDVTAA